LTGYGQRPLHLLGAIGLGLLALGGVGLLYLAIEWIRGHGPIGSRPLLAYSALALGVGVQLLCLGILAELITSYHVRSRPIYSVVERIEPENEEGASLSAEPALPHRSEQPDE